MYQLAVAEGMQPEPVQVPSYASAAVNGVGGGHLDQKANSTAYNQNMQSLPNNNLGMGAGNNPARKTAYAAN